MKRKNEVLRTPPADPKIALAHFEALFTFETDCWDVHTSLELEDPGFIFLDVRSEEHFNDAHIPGALSLPHWKITAKRLADHPPSTLFVVYCAGPHCNGAARAAAGLSRLGRPVKIMVGGVEGWKDEGFSLVSS